MFKSVQKYECCVITCMLLYIHCKHLSNNFWYRLSDLAVLLNYIHLIYLKGISPAKTMNKTSNEFPKMRKFIKSPAPN